MCGGLGSQIIIIIIIIIIDISEIHPPDMGQCPILRPLLYLPLLYHNTYILMML